MQNQIFDNPISTYASEQAIEDGVLFDPFPNKNPRMLLTASIHAAIEQVDDGRSYKAKVVPLVMDALMLAKAYPNGSPWTDGLDGNVTGGPVWFALNEYGGLTLMRPEDY